MIRDEPAFAASLPSGALEKVKIMARAMCSLRDGDGEDDEPCGCESDGSSCIAFGLFGDYCWAALQALAKDGGANG